LAAQITGRDGILGKSQRRTIMKSTTLTSPLTTAQLAEMIGMTEQQMICEGFDLDLADATRWLIEEKVDLDNWVDVLAALGEMVSSRHPQGLVDAAIILARNSTLELTQ
jgi:hypothetical protein